MKTFLSGEDAEGREELRLRLGCSAFCISAAFYERKSLFLQTLTGPRKPSCAFGTGWGKIVDSEEMGCWG